MLTSESLKTLFHRSEPRLKIAGQMPPHSLFLFIRGLFSFAVDSFWRAASTANEKRPRILSKIDGFISEVADLIAGFR